MPDLTTALASNRAAVDEMIDVAVRAGGHWHAPRAPGKWSPAQVVEHVAIALEEYANVAAGRPSKIPTLPAIVRPLARLVFYYIIRQGRLPKAKTSRAMTPAHGPPTAADARARLHEALARFESEVRLLEAARRPVPSGAFGEVPVEDFVRFAEAHTRHHTKQIPVAL